MSIVWINIKRLLSNATYIFGVMLFILAGCILSLYQEQSAPVTGAFYKDCLEWCLSQPDPETAVSELYEESLTAISYEPRFGRTRLEDMQLLEEVESYIESCGSYQEWLSDTCAAARTGATFTVQSYSARLQSLLTARQYEKLTGRQVQAGNYLAWQKIFAPGMMEAVLVILLLYTAYHLLIIEREKGLNELVHAAPGGGHRYFACKMLASLLQATILFVLVFGVKLAIYLGLYGSGDLTQSLQAVPGYMSAPFSLSVGAYAALYILYQYAFFAVLVLIIGAFSALSLSEAGICVGFAGLAVISALLGYGIRDYSRWHIFKNLSLLSLQNTQNWFAHMNFWYVGSLLGMDLYLQNLQFPLLALVIYGVCAYATGTVLYARGLKASAGRKQRLTNLWSYKGQITGNELVYVLLQKKSLLLVVVVIAIFFATCSFQLSENDMLRYEKSIRQNLNSQSFDDACQWLTKKQDEFQTLYEEQEELTEKLMQGTLSEQAYEMAIMEIQRQLTTEPIVTQFADQVERLRTAGENLNKEIPFDYETLEQAAVGNSGRYERLLCAMLIAFFVILGILPIMPGDRQSGFSVLMGTTRGAKSAVHRRILWMEVQVFVTALVITALWMFSLGSRYEWLGWGQAMQSWERYAGSHLNGSLGMALCMNVLVYSLEWALFAGCLAGITLFFKSSVWAELLGIFFLIGPLTLELLNISWASRIPYVSVMLFGSMDVFTGVGPVLWIIAMVIAQKLVISIGWRRWIA
jgi:hypothetical protein